MGPGTINTDILTALPEVLLAVGAMGLLLLGAFREILGYGTLLAQAELMFGEGAEWLTITLIDDYRGFLLAILPPGAFLGLGLMIALKNVIDKRRAQRAAQMAATPEAIKTSA